MTIFRHPRFVTPELAELIHYPKQLTLSSEFNVFARCFHSVPIWNALCHWSEYYHPKEVEVTS